MAQLTVSLDSDLFEKINEVAKKTEKRINHLEATQVGLDIPSVNELRYCFNHLLRHLAGDVEGGKDVYKHVRRALYDCYETESLFILDAFSTFETDYATFPIQRVVPSYMDWAQKFTELQEFMQNTPRDDREDYYEQLEVLLVEFRPIKSALRAARQEINKEIEDQNKAERKSQQNLRVAIWSAAGTVLAALIAAIALLK